MKKIMNSFALGLVVLLGCFIMSTPIGQAVTAFDMGAPTIIGFVLKCLIS